MLNFSLCKEEDTHRAEGVAVLSYRLEYPDFSGKGAARPRAAVGEVLAECRRFIALCAARAEREYLASEDPHRRFRFVPYRVELCYAPCFVGTAVFSFSVTCAVLRGHRRLGFTRFGETVRRRDGRSLSAAYFLSPRVARRTATFFLNAEGEVCLPEEKPPRKEKRFPFISLQKRKNKV